MAEETKPVRKTYNLSVLALSPDKNEPIIDEKDKQMTICDMIIRAFKIRAQQENPDQEQINFHRKIVKKLEKAEDISSIALNSKAIEAIKTRVRTVYYPGLAFQVTEAFDGEPTEAQLDEI